MKMIFNIARNELRNLIYSPVAWFLTIVFLVQCSVLYTVRILKYAKRQDASVSNYPDFSKWDESFTELIFSQRASNAFFSVEQGGLFESVVQNLFLFIPLLTMGLINREINNGSIKLLYSSPVSSTRIVLGKYLSMMLYLLFLVSIVGIFMVTGAFNIRSVDYGIFCSAALGIYLLACAYAAIGLFMSSVTTYQIISALGSFAILFALGHVGKLWQDVDFVRDVTYFLSMQDRAGNMLKGLITTKDVAYFLVIICMFLGFTISKLNNGREFKPWWSKAGGYMLIIVLCVLTGYISSRPRLVGYWDTTARSNNTIHPRTQKIIKELGDSTLEVTLYTNLLHGTAKKGLPESRNNYLSELWEPYVRFKPDIKFKYEYYYEGQSSPGKTLEEFAEKEAEALDTRLSRFKSPKEMRKIINLDPEDYRLVMTLKYKGRTEYLRTFGRSDYDLKWPNQQNVNAALKKLLQQKRPKICYVSGGLERSIYKGGEREYSNHTIAKGIRSSLINYAGFVLDTINLTTHDIPGDASMLVLADPKMDLSPLEQDKLKSYIDGGGNMFILGEPGKQYVLAPFLQHLGVQLMPWQLVEVSNYETPEKVSAYLTELAADFAEEDRLLDYKRSIKENKPNALQIMMPGATGISYANDSSAFNIKPLFMTLPRKAWLETGPLVIDSANPVFNAEEGDRRGMRSPEEKRRPVVADLMTTSTIMDSPVFRDSISSIFSPQEKELENSFPTGIALTRKINNKEQRIIVCGDADFMSNARVNDYGFNIANSIYSWLYYNEYPVYTPELHPADNLLTITSQQAKVLKVIYIWILPGVILLLGTILLIRRKRK
jgi:gliding motility-associated transport system permease protein/gliding motility-associatede transport system auxiliary component